MHPLFAWVFFSLESALTIGPAVGTFVGLALFYQGFRLLQRKHLIANTPTSKIRSASLGLVEVNGLAVGPYTLTAPISGKSCYFYRTVVSQLNKSGNNKEEWQTVIDECLHVPFFLDDNTGQILVDPQRAELDLHCDLHEEYSNVAFLGKGVPENVLLFMAQRGFHIDHKIRVDEYCIKPKNALFILGTVAENPGITVSPKAIRTEHASPSQLTLQTPQLLGGTLSMTMGPLQSMQQSVTHRQVIFLSGERESTTTTTSSQMTQQGKIAAALLKAGISRPEAWAAAGIDQASVAVSGAPAGGSLQGSASGQGTPLTQPFDLSPKVVIKKGENNPAFFISWRSQQKVLSAMGWKSVACIWGGPALILASVYIFLAHFGWL